MSVKIYDTMTTATPNFPLAYAEKINIVKEDGSEADIQTLYNNGELSGGDNSIITTEAEYLALPEEDKLNNSYYLYDIGVHYKNGVAYSRKKPIQLTMEEYKALGEVDPDQEYIISADEQGILLGAEDIGYNNAESGIQATTVQGAIDKIAEKVDGLISDTTSSMDKVVKYPDWSNQQTISQTEITVDQDVYIELNQLSSSPIDDLKINGKDVSVSDFNNGLYSTRFSGYVKKGSFVSYPYLTNANIVRVFPLV